MSASQKVQEEWINVLNKGIITIPKKIRDQIGIKEGDIAKIRVQDNSIIIEPKEEKYRLFTDKQIKEWEKEDEVTPDLVNKIDELWPDLP